MRYLVVTFALLFIACGSSPTAPTGPPVIRSFTTNHPAIAMGERAVLSWDITGGEAHWIDPLGHVSASGSQSVSPVRSTVYVLTARNGAGESSRSITVAVTQPRPALPGL